MESGRKRSYCVENGVFNDGAEWMVMCTLMVL